MTNSNISIGCYKIWSLWSVCKYYCYLIHCGRHALSLPDREGSGSLMSVWSCCTVDFEMLMLCAELKWALYVGQSLGNALTSVPTSTVCSLLCDMLVDHCAAKLSKVHANRLCSSDIVQGRSSLISTVDFIYNVWNYLPSYVYSEVYAFAWVDVPNMLITRERQLRI